MTFQLPATRTQTIYIDQDENLEFVTEYSLVRVGRNQLVHLGEQNIFDGDKPSRLSPSCGADFGNHKSKSRKVDASEITCKNCLKQLDKLNS